jgi:hypothetical protein
MIPLLVPGLICGIGFITAPSRCTWAFRDGCIPDSGWWKTVHKKLDIPFNALVPWNGRRDLPRSDLLRFLSCLQRLLRCWCYLLNHELCMPHRRLSDLPPS